MKEELRKQENITQGERRENVAQEVGGTPEGSNGRDSDQILQDARQEILLKNVEHKRADGSCNRCGKIGHRPEACPSPVICVRCQKEGHVPRVCSEIMPWECIAPFCGFTAPGKGFHYIHSDNVDEGTKEMANCALIKITKGEVSARQLEHEFKAQAGPNSTWRWFAKKISNGTFQMRFPTAKKKLRTWLFSLECKWPLCQELRSK